MREDFDEFSNRKYSYFEYFTGEFFVHSPIMAKFVYLFRSVSVFLSILLHFTEHYGRRSVRTIHFTGSC